MNLALYGRGGKRWAMTERPAAALARDADHLRIGPSSLAWDGTTLTAEIHETTAPLPTRLRGTIRLHPDALSTHVVALDGIGRHRWSPIAPGARVTVDMHDPKLAWQGHAYFDTNSGDEPLEEGFRAWDWCRAKLQDGVAVLYHGERRDGTQFCTALRYDAQGRRPPDRSARLRLARPQLLGHGVGHARRAWLYASRDRAAGGRAVLRTFGDIDASLRRGCARGAREPVAGPVRGALGAGHAAVQGATMEVSKQGLLFRKRSKKLLSALSRIADAHVSATRLSPETKVFCSFFQKRTACFLA